MTATFEPDQSAHGAYERLRRGQEALYALLVASARRASEWPVGASSTTGPRP
ncbi:MAG TPA: hypothetical protein VFD01_22515 [Candidatus Dormibacteraeota bacterium]|nr:hypothetical protein [Candidatus Dormibacteraeota bacterium]